MKPISTTGPETRSGALADDRFTDAVDLDEQFAELIETVWACERQWTVDDRFDAAIKYGRI